MRYSLFAPRSSMGRSTSQARWRRTWARLARRPGRQARRSVGRHTVSRMPCIFSADRLEDDCQFFVRT
jgi:hypothetical protein